MSAPRRASFVQVLRVLMMTVVVLVGVRLAAPVLNPVFFAVVLSLLFGPIYAWLGRRGLPKPVALVLMLILVIFYVLGASIARFSSGISTYSSELSERLGAIQVLLDRLGLAQVNLRDVVEPRALTGAVGIVLSGIAGFLSNLFLILMIVLFLLAEGPALMDQLRASAGADHPQVERLASVGRGVVRQFGLRAILNLVTAAGVTVLLLVLAWALASVGFSVYLANFADYGLTYGSLGAAVGLLVYLNISAPIVLVGAELNAALHPGAAEQESSHDDEV